MKWIRVSKKRCCKICGKADWCAYSPDLGLALCMRVESTRPSKNSMGGWLHRIGHPIRVSIPTRVPVKETAPDLKSLWRRWITQTDSYHVDGYAMSLGVDTDALRSIGCAWADGPWAFPMHDAKREMIGIRLRGESGKWAVRGSKQGLFLPENSNSRELFIVEGPTDLAAALTIGLPAIGRPACMGQEDLILEYLKLKSIQRVVIVTDNDRPDRLGRRAGLSGAERLQARLTVMNCVWIPPAKDLREFLLLGGDRQIIDSSLKDLVWTRPRGVH